MAATPVRQWGTTPPISASQPKKEDIQHNEQLIEELKNQNCFEGQEESNKRVEVLGILQSLAETFVKKTYTVKGMPEHLVQNAGGKIFTYGSYRLGAYGPGSDIDTLLVGPAHVLRADFFTHVPGLLAELIPPAEEVSPVPDAFVPIIKFKLQGISIDLIFARLPTVGTVPKTLSLESKELLKGCDESNLRGLNGVRLTDELLGLVPNTTVFRQALRAIKLWAKSRAIYANIMGFPGGIAWAMLVARICQLYPYAVSAVVVAKFFVIYQKWLWPQPVLLKSLEEGSSTGLRVWNPKLYPSDRGHLMPVITPNYPSMCATHNITKSTKAIILREMVRASSIVNDIMQGQKPWKALFERHTFFTRDYRYYLRVIAATKSSEEQIQWSGTVESKLRHLVSKLEQIESIELAHPFNKGFDKEHQCKTEEESIGVAHGEYQVSSNENGVTTKETNLRKEDGNDDSSPPEASYKVYTTTFYIGLEIDSEKSKSVDISWASQEFYDICKSWPKYNEDQHSIHIRYTRSFELPEDVFLPGESKPVKPTKKKIVKRKAITSTNGTNVPLKRPAEQAPEIDGKKPRTTSIPSHTSPIQA